MENRRFILIALLGVVLFFMYQAWQKDHGPKPLPTAAVSTDALDAPPSAQTPSDVPSAAAPATAAATTETATARATGQRIVVDTDVMHVEIALDGGDLRRVDLKQYAVSKDQPDSARALLDDRTGRYFVLQSGIAGAKAPLVTHRSAFTSAQAAYKLADGHHGKTGLRDIRKDRIGDD